MPLILLFLFLGMAPLSAQEECCFEPCYMLSASALYWTACQDDLDFAVEDGAAQAGSFLVGGKVRSLEYGWDTGFRLRSSECLPYAGWKLETAFTMWQVKNRAQANAPAGGILHASLFPGVYDDNAIFASHAQAELTTHYNVLDILLANTCDCECGCELRPYGGIRILWFRERIVTEYTGRSFASTGDNAHWDVHFNAAGLALGIKGKQAICGTLSLTGHLGGAILGGEPKHRTQWFKATPLVIGTPATLSVTDTSCLVVATWDASLELTYDSCCCGFPVLLAAGYEAQDWWNMPRPRRYFDGTPTESNHAGRLLLHGAFLRLAICY